MVTIRSDKRRMPRYYITEGERSEVLFESESAIEVINWAIEHATAFEMVGEFDLDRPLTIKKHNVSISGKDCKKEEKKNGLARSL